MDTKKPKAPALKMGADAVGIADLKPLLLGGRHYSRQSIMCPFNYKKLIVFLFLILLPKVAIGEIVTYVDKDGVRHITDLKSDRPLGASPKPTALTPEAQPQKNEAEKVNNKTPRTGFTVDYFKKGTVTIITKDGFGSGFLITPEGHILTNAHVIKDNRFVKVQFYDGTSKEAYVIKNSPEIDLALLKTPGEDHYFLTASDSSNYKEGDEVYIVGAPKGLHYTLTQGIISSLRKIPLNGKKLLFIQTDAPVSSGSSGSPLIKKSDGKVIGLITYKWIGLGVEGLGFALAFDEIKKHFNLETINKNSSSPN